MRVSRGCEGGSLYTPLGSAGFEFSSWISAKLLRSGCCSSCANGHGLYLSQSKPKPPPRPGCSAECPTAAPRRGVHPPLGADDQRSSGCGVHCHRLGISVAVKGRQGALWNVEHVADSLGQSILNSPQHLNIAHPSLASPSTRWLLSEPFPTGWPSPLCLLLHPLPADVLLSLTAAHVTGTGPHVAGIILTDSAERAVR
jgi:hypothetical protein